MSVRVPVVYHEQDSFFHRRDSRVKLGLFAMMVVFIYLAPTWEWVAGLVVIGLFMAAVAKLSKKWAIVLFALQLPNILALLAGPLFYQWILGDLAFDEDLQTGLKLSLTWTAALFVSISLASTMDVDEITDGLRGLKLPEMFCFLVGYVFVLLYISVSDVIRVADAMRLKGVEFETKNPFRFVAGLPRLIIPAIFVIVRRASTMMAVLQMRGFSFTKRTKKVELGRLDVMDASLLAVGFLILGATAAARLDILPLFT